MAEPAVKPATLSEDFIGFDWDEEEDAEFYDNEDETAAPSAHAVGQPQLYTKGRKRTAEEMEKADDGYSKKQRIAAESRVTPWAVDVDWDNCRNAADM